MPRTISRAMIPALLAALLAGCSADTLSPTEAPTLNAAELQAGLASARGGNGGGGNGGGGGGGGGGRDDAPPTITLGGAMATAVAETVKIHKDSKRAFTAGGDISTTMAFGTSRAAAEGALESCAVVPADTTVERQLEMLSWLENATPRTRNLWMSVDRTRLDVPAAHGIGLHGGGISIGIGDMDLLPEAGGVTVSENTPGAFVYSGGAVQIQDVRGQELEHVSLACPNLDTITAVVTQ